MSKPQIKTNNDERFLEVKVQLRLNSVNMLNKQEVYILEAYGGEGVLWEMVKERTDKILHILSIDRVVYNRVQLQGDNVKFLKGIDLSMFDIIDLDAYGVPFVQLCILFESGYKGIVHCTFIQTMFGSLNKKMLYSLGYSKVMIKKIPSLFNRNGFDKFKLYLSMNSVKKIFYFSEDKKSYLFFVIS